MNRGRFNPSKLRRRPGELQIQRVASPRNHRFQGVTVADRNPFLLRSNCRLSFAVDAVHALVIRDECLREPRVCAAGNTRTERVPRRAPAAVREDGIVSAAATLIPPGRRAQPEEPAGPPKTAALRVDQATPPRCAWRRGLPGFCDDRFQRLDVERLLRHDLLRPPVLILQPFQPLAVNPIRNLCRRRWSCAILLCYRLVVRRESPDCEVHSGRVIFCAPE